jgi:RNA-binding protein
MNLTSKERAKLRAIGNGIESLVRVGKDGMSSNIVDSLNDVLRTRELVKVKMLNNSEEDIKSVAAELAEKSGAEIIHIMGKTILLFKENKEKPVVSDKLKGL